MPMHAATVGATTGHARGRALTRRGPDTADTTIRTTTGACAAFITADRIIGINSWRPRPVGDVRTRPCWEVENSTDQNAGRHC